MQPPLRSLLLICVLAARCGLSSAPVHGEWRDTRTVDVFDIRSEFSLTDARGSSLLAELPRLRRDIETLLGVSADAQPIEVNLFASRRSYQKYLSVRVPEGASRQALYVQGTDRGRVYVHRHAGFEVDIRHECTHALLHNALPYVPMWLDEGLAEYFEVPAHQRATGNPHHSAVRRAMLIHWKPSLPHLENLDDLNSMSGSDYRDSWAWVHYFLHGPQDARQALSNYLYDVRMGNPAGLLSERLAAEAPDSPRRLARHFRDFNSM
ncbi:MAG: hypothetical protein KF861_06010 [Planctomycetaceae bacterium]|nr:hypothetical protein [Planctomycetaceae bacterium]